MKPDRFVRLKEALIHAEGLPRPERKRYLDQVLADDPELRTEAEALLVHSDSSDDILGTDAVVPDRPSQSTETIVQATTTSEPDWFAGYRILRQIGEGGMGVVYEALQENPNRKVALKIIRSEAAAGESILKRFRFEIQVLGQLNHPGIARVYDAGENDKGVPYFSMELIRGTNLTEHAERENLTTRERLELMALVCDAVDYAHEAGVIHRDLKPGNILVEVAPGMKPQPKILDFGVARAVHAGLYPATSHTMTGQLVGTLSYMSPEQVSGAPDDLDVRSDVYQLGVILYELLSGTLPYAVSGLSVPQACSMILEKDPTSLRTIDPSFRGDLEAIAGKALFKEKERRYASAAAMAEDVRRHLRDEPITARPASGFYRLRKLAKRHREVVAGGIISLVALLTVITFFILRGPDVEGEHAGPAETQLTAFPPGIFLEDAAISPDGETVAFADYDRGIFLQEIATKEIVPVRLPDSLAKPLRATWHPTENKVFARFDGPPGRYFLLGLDNPAEPSVSQAHYHTDEVPEPYPNYLQVSPDARTLAVVPSVESELWVVEDGDIRVLLQSSDSDFNSPTWSPTGESVAFLRFSNDGASLETSDLAGNTTVIVEVNPRLAHRLGMPTSPRLTWLPDERLVYTRAMAAPRQSSSEVMSIRVDPSTGARKGDPVLLAGWPGYAVKSPTSPTTGEPLTLIRNQVQDEIYVVDLDESGGFEGDPRRFTFDERTDHPGAWSRDSQEFLFMSDRFGQMDLMTKSLVGESENRLLENCNLLCLSPEGDELLVQRDLGEASQVYLVSMSSGSEQPVCVLQPNEELLCGSAPGSWCVLMRYSDEGTVSFHRLDEEWRPDVELGHAQVDEVRGRFGYSWDLSPDAEEISLVQFSGLVSVLNSRTGKWRDIVQTKTGLQGGRYSADGQCLYVSSWGPYAIVKITLDGDVDELWRSDFWVFRPCPSPDGRKLAFGVRMEDSDIWMLEDF